MLVLLCRHLHKIPVLHKDIFIKIDSGSWQDLPNNFILSNSGQYNISVAVADAAGNVSSSVSDIIYIDKLAPVINNVSQTVSSGSCVISVNTSDAGLSGLKETKYASGSHDAAYFTSGGTSFTDGAFTVSTGGIYTIYIYRITRATLLLRIYIKYCSVNS